MFVRECHDLAYLGLGNLTSIYATNPDSTLVYVQHDAGCIFAVLMEKPLQHDNDKLHRSIIVI